MRNANQMPSFFLILSHDRESRPIDDFRKLSPGVYCVDLSHSHDPPLMPKRTFKHNAVNAAQEFRKPRFAGSDELLAQLYPSSASTANFLCHFVVISG
jgi:hypothetical protein